MAMVPHERSLVNRFKDKPFVLVGVNLDGTPQRQRRAEQEFEMTWPSWWDGPDGPIARTYDIDGLPSFFFIDHRGVVRNQYEGMPRSPEVIDRVIAKLVAEAESSAAEKQ